MSAPSSSALRPALELALAVARAGVGAVPPVPPPPPLRPLLRFARLPDRALDTVRAVVDADPEFRLRVGEVADPDALGRVPWLWLARPDGWAGEVAAAVEEASVVADAAEAERSERRATRRLAAVEGRLVALEAELAAALNRAEGIAEELAAERGARRRAEDAVADAGREMAIAERRCAEMEVEVDQAEAALLAAEERTRAAEDHLRAARSEVAAGRRREADGAEREAALRHRLERSTAGLAAAHRQRDGVASSVAAAARAAADLGAALAETAAALGPVAPPAPPPPVAAPAPTRSPGRARPGHARRRPLALPGGIWDDSVDAARHLLATPGAVLLVDGYNVTLAVWPDLSLEDQRHRLVSALGEAALRTGTTIEVVFDGAGNVLTVVGGPGGRDPVRVVFSPAGVDADDVIIERARRLPPEAPVVVATDDRRVRDAVAALGANVIGTAQLVQALGRRPG